MVAAVGFGAAKYLATNDDAMVIEGDSKGLVEEESYVDAGGLGSTSDLGAGVEFNGEEVRRSMENWRFTEAVRAGVTGLAFFMGVVGIWGDGTGVRQAVVV